MAAAASRPSGLFNAKFTFKLTSPPMIFARIVRPINALQLRRGQISHKETFPQNFLNRSAVKDHYDVHLGLIGKHVVDFLLVLIELFSLDVTVEALRVKIDRKSAISLQRGHFDLKFQVEWDVPTNNFCIDS